MFLVRITNVPALLLCIGMFALFVSLEVRLEERDLFLEAIAKQAAASLGREPGCIRFEVCADIADPSHFFLYEEYVSQEAFEQHKQTDHFGVWREAAARYVVKQVNTQTLKVSTPTDPA